MAEDPSPMLPPAEESIETPSGDASERDAESSELSANPTSESYFVCSGGEWRRSVCEGLPFYKEHENKRYCVLHYPGKEKAAEFKVALDKKLNERNFDFGGVWFPERISFGGFVFDADADFRDATFSADAEFFQSVFHASACFVGASFEGSVGFFGTATVRELYDGDWLAPKALAKNPSLDFQHARVEHPDRIEFHTLILRPHWFVNVDPREFVFTDVSWDWEHMSIDDEIAALKAKEVSSPKSLLAIACRQLAENAEANTRYEEASNFRYWAMDLARRTKWKGWTLWKTDWLHMFYWAVSGYGEKILRALGVLAAVLIIFALLYTKVGFDKPLPKRRAVTYSFAVMSLQKPEPKPLTGTAQTVVLLETILGPVQAALLALAIRRKFMR